MRADSRLGRAGLTNRRRECGTLDRLINAVRAGQSRGVSEELYDKVVIPLNLTRPGTADLPS